MKTLVKTVIASSIIAASVSANAGGVWSLSCTHIAPYSSGAALPKVHMTITNDNQATFELAYLSQVTMTSTSTLTKVGNAPQTVTKTAPVVEAMVWPRFQTNSHGATVDLLGNVGTQLGYSVSQFLVANKGWVIFYQDMYAQFGGKMVAGRPNGNLYLYKKLPAPAGTVKYNFFAMSCK